MSREDQATKYLNFISLQIHSQSIAPKLFQVKLESNVATVLSDFSSSCDKTGSQALIVLIHNTSPLPSPSHLSIILPYFHHLTILPSYHLSIILPQNRFSWPMLPWIGPWTWFNDQLANDPNSLPYESPNPCLLFSHHVIPNQAYKLHWLAWLSGYTLDELWSLGAFVYLNQSSKNRGAPFLPRPKQHPAKKAWQRMDRRIIWNWILKRAVKDGDHDQRRRSSQFLKGIKLTVSVQDTPLPPCRDPGAGPAAQYAWKSGLGQWPGRKECEGWNSAGGFGSTACNANTMYPASA